MFPAPCDWDDAKNSYKWREMRIDAISKGKTVQVIHPSRLWNFHLHGDYCTQRMHLEQPRSVTTSRGVEPMPQNVHSKKWKNKQTIVAKTDPLVCAAASCPRDFCKVAEIALNNASSFEDGAFKLLLNGCISPSKDVFPPQSPKYMVSMSGLFP
jgi:hypothetical protein